MLTWEIKLKTDPNPKSIEADRYYTRERLIEFVDSAQADAVVAAYAIDEVLWIRRVDRSALTR